MKKLSKKQLEKAINKAEVYKTMLDDFSYEEVLKIAMEIEKRNLAKCSG